MNAVSIMQIVHQNIAPVTSFAPRAIEIDTSKSYQSFNEKSTIEQYSFMK